jgi:small subunit ribosomal protein S16
LIIGYIYDFIKNGTGNSSCSVPREAASGGCSSFVTNHKGKTKMLKIRLKRLGAKKAPAYRIIVINSTTKREGKPIQELGHYNPKTKIMKLNKEAALEWIKKGAQPTETVKYLIDNANADGSLNYKKSKTVKLSKKAKARLDAEKEAAAKAKEDAKAAKEAEKEAEKAEAAITVAVEEATVCEPSKETAAAEKVLEAAVEEPTPVEE